MAAPNIYEQAAGADGLIRFGGAPTAPNVSGAAQASPVPNMYEAAAGPDGLIRFGGQPTTKPEISSDENGLWNEAYNTLLNAGVGYTSGVEAAGALTELVFPEWGESLRQSGKRGTQALVEKMDPAWQEAINKSWLDLSAGGAARDPRAWIAGLAQTIPSMISTGGLGGLGTAGLKAVGYAGAKKLAATEAEKLAAKAAARKVAYPVAGGVVGGGQAAAGAAEATDEAGLGPEAARQAAATAAPFGFVGGAFLGGAVERLIPEAAKGAIIKSTARTAFGEAAEEGFGQLGTEVAKERQGLGFEPTNIAEAAVGGAAIGGGIGGAVAAPSAVGAVNEKRRQKKANAAADAAERQAIEAAATAATGENQPTENVAEGPEIVPTPPVSSPPGAPTQSGPPPGAPPPTGAVPPEPPVSAASEMVVTELGQPDLGTMKNEKDRVFVRENTKALETLQGEIAALNTSLAENGKAMNQENTRGQMVKLKAKGKELTKALTGAQKKVAVLITTRKAFLEDHAKRNPPLDEDNDTGAAEAEVAASEAELSSTLVKELPPDAEEGPDVPVVDIGTTRSQRARQAAITKRAKKAADTAEAQANKIVDATPSGGNPAVLNQGGSAEIQALRSRNPEATSTPGVVPNAEAAIAPAPEPLATIPSDAITAPVETNTVGPTPPPVQPGAPPPTGAVPPSAPVPQRQQRGVRSAPSTSPGITKIETGDGQVVAQDISSEAPATDVTNPGISSEKKAPPKPRSRMSPLERLENLLKTGPKDVDTVLAAMQDAANNEKDPRLFKLIQTLRRAFPNSKKNPLTLTVENKVLRDGFQGLYIPKDDKIYIDLAQAEDGLTTVLHEIVHAAVLAKMRTDPKAAAFINEIMADARKQWAALNGQPDVDSMVGFNSAEEFISEALTNFDFADKLAVLPARDKSQITAFGRLRRRLSFSLGLHEAEGSVAIFDTLMSFIPDGSLLSDGNIQAFREEMKYLGVTTPVASMLSTFRMSLRATAAASAVPVGRFQRLWGWTLPVMTAEQISRSYGAIGQGFGTRHDIVNNWYRLIGARAGKAAKIRATYDSVVAVILDALDSQGGGDFFDDMAIDARLWSIHPDRPPTDPTNAYGMAQPGGAEAYNELSRRWNDPRMTPKKKLAFQMLRDSSTGMRDHMINLMMYARARSLAGAANADSLQAYINALPQIEVRYTRTGLLPAGSPPSPDGEINLSRQLVPTAAQIATEVGRWGLNPTKTSLVIKELSKVQSTLGQEQGPYIPLRREGNHYTVVKSADIHRTLTKAQFDKLINDNRNQNRADGLAEGDIEVTEQKINPAGMYEITYRHISVTAHDTEAGANIELHRLRDQWSKRGKVIGAQKSALSLDGSLDTLKITNPALDALKKEVIAAIPGPAGQQAADQIAKFYLEKIPDTSVRKGELRARKIAGASRDVAHVYAKYAQGFSYFASQMEFGHQFAALKTTQAREDRDALHTAGQHDQAKDLAAIVNHITERDEAYSRLSAKDQAGVTGFFSQLWRNAPQMAGAWLLTGPGTIITNGLQPTMVGLPYFSARYGLPGATAAYGKAYGKVTGSAVKETLKEAGRFVAGLRRGLSGNIVNIRDPFNQFYATILSRCSPEEKALIQALAEAKKIDFGLVADIQQLAQRTGPISKALNYLSTGAFIVPQAIETVNRVTTALTSYDLRGAPALTTDIINQIAADIDQTQINYSQENKSLWAQGETLRAALTFKTYAQAVLYNVLKTFMEAIRGGGPGRAVAIKYLAGLTVTTMAASGLMGIMQLDPIYAIALLLAAAAGEEDPEQALRKAMQDFVSEATQDMLLRGLPQGSGLADTSRMGLPQIFPLDEFRKVATDPDSNYGAWTGLVGEFYLGAPGSVAADAVKGAFQIAGGDYAQGLVSITPKAFGINDAIRATSYGVQGAKDSRGYTFAGPETFDIGELAVRTLGFEPAEIAESKAKRRASLSLNRRLVDERSELMQKFSEAQLAKDYETRAEALQEIKKFNKAHRAFGITRSGLISSVKSRARGEIFTDRFGFNASTRGARSVAAEIEARYN